MPITSHSQTQHPANLHAYGDRMEAERLYCSRAIDAVQATAFYQRMLQNGIRAEKVMYDLSIHGPDVEGRTPLVLIEFLWNPATNNYAKRARIVSWSDETDDVAPETSSSEHPSATDTESVGTHDIRDDMRDDGDDIVMDLEQEDAVDEWEA